jgi:membrane fusion protein (multidrug efflux system)
MRSLAFVALLGIAAVGCRRPDDAMASQRASEAAAAVHVQTAQVAERPMPVFLTVTGTLRANQESDIAADASGKVLQTLVERGQTVKRGQVIATLDARSAALSAAVAEAQAKVAQSQLEEARRECERVKHLFDTGAISQAEFERQTANCTAQQWSATAAEAQQANAVKLLGDTRVRAPFDGIIGERYVNVGQYVQPQTRVASVYAPDPLRLQVTVPEAELANVKQDMPVAFTVAAFADERFTGAVKYISPNVREATRDLVVEAVVPNPDARLKPGMFAVARLELGMRPRVAVPTAAVVRDDTSARIFVVVSQQVQERLVQVGDASGDLVVVNDGVKPGENVVVKPGPDVRDGARVE